GPNVVLAGDLLRQCRYLLVDVPAELHVHLEDGVVGLLLPLSQASSKKGDGNRAHYGRPSARAAARRSAPVWRPLSAVRCAAISSSVILSTFSQMYSSLMPMLNKISAVRARVSIRSASSSSSIG